MEVSFYKIRLFRNDFILIPPQREFEIRDELASQLSRNLCRRRIAVGATGLIVVDIESSQAPRIRIFDRTGRKVSRLLDALLCAGRYLFDSGRTDGRTLEISTDIGIAELLIVDSQQFEADVGTPTDPESGGAIDPSPTTYSGTNIVIEGRRYAATAVGLSATFPALVQRQGTRRDRREGTASGIRQADIARRTASLLVAAERPD